MTLNSRLIELKRKHMSLSQAVELAQKHPASDHSICFIQRIEAISGKPQQHLPSHSKSFLSSQG